MSMSMGGVRIEGELPQESTLHEGLEKLVHTAEYPENTVMDWGLDDWAEYTVKDGKEAYWIGPVETPGTGFAYLQPIDTADPDVQRLLENTRENTLDQLSQEQTPWKYQINAIIAPTELQETPAQLYRKARKKALQHGNTAIAKNYDLDI